MRTGIILKSISGFYTVRSDGELIVCKARGRLRVENTTPLVGDHVEITINDDGTGAIDRLLPRKNAFVRPPIANLDQLVIIVAAVIPVTDPFLIDRMTAIAAQNGCEAVICINKSDLDQGDTLFETYTRCGFKTIRTSAETGEGIDELSAAVCGKISAFTGNSGVGKSSILNALEPDFNIQTADVSKKLGRGRHTTRHVELFTLANGAVVADTPGFSSFDTEAMEMAGKRELQNLFIEFEPFLGSCRYNDCAHIKERGCAVLDAVGDGVIPVSRHESYARLYEQLSRRNEWA